MKTTKSRATGHLSGRTKPLVSLLRHANGLIGWRREHGRSLRREPALRMVEFMQWKAIRRDAWDCLTTWAGSGGRRRGFRSSAFRGVRFNPIISWKRYYIYFTWLPGGRP